MLILDDDAVDQHHIASNLLVTYNRNLDHRWRARIPLSSFFDSLRLSLAQEARDYVRATRAQFITACETARIAVGR